MSIVLAYICILYYRNIICFMSLYGYCVYSECVSELVYKTFPIYISVFRNVYNYQHYESVN